MQIQSAFNSGVQGFEKATQDANKAAENIVSETIASRNAEQSIETKPVNETTQMTNEPDGLTESMVNLKVAEVQAKASANVIQAADENLGTLIDVRA